MPERLIPWRHAIAAISSRLLARRLGIDANAGSEKALRFPLRQSSESHAKRITSHVVRKVGHVAPRDACIRDKIRQQLQVLRDLGLLTFLGSGSYRLRCALGAAAIGLKSAGFTFSPGISPAPAFVPFLRTNLISSFSFLVSDF